MEYQEWLDSLKVGNEVLISGKYGGGYLYFIGTIERITPTREIKIGALVFKNGSEGERSLIKIEPVTQEVRENIKHKELSRFLIDYRFENLPLNALEEISNILDKAERE
ncbi:hypothetical protein [Paenibacillus sp. FSL L8-0709]|uniref:hypothetical protein n=1 Tax=Paenibacillus sp. FSL L8-0709 TaxID=2975312 RepID=UPI0030F652D4